LRSHASISLRFGDRALGLLNAARAQNPSLSPSELETLATIGAQVGVAVERSRLAERAASAARIEERAALARELHDTIVQELAAIALHLESAERKAESQPGLARERIATAIELSRKALDDLRRSVDGLRNDPLEGESLVTALSRLARKFTSETGVQVTLQIPRSDVRLGSALEFTIFRIVSEALTNVRRHARARRVEVQLDMRADGTTLRVRDDGAGFDTETGHDGFGLLGMRERAESLGGSFAVTSSPDGGTSLEARLPVTS
jgi:signal transduction histidine kinase